jgi:hypothetical protein
MCIFTMTLAISVPVYFGTADDWEPRDKTPTTDQQLSPGDKVCVVKLNGAWAYVTWEGGNWSERGSGWIQPGRIREGTSP